MLNCCVRVNLNYPGSDQQSALVKLLIQLMNTDA